MGLETGTYISDLVATNPVGATDDRATADDHLRLIKAVLKATFPNINGAVTATPAQLNVLAGTFIQTLLDDTNAATARATLGLGTAAIENANTANTINTLVKRDASGYVYVGREATVTLGGDYSGTNNIKIVRIGNVVTLTATGPVSHASSGNVASAAGIIPAWARPTAAVSVVYGVTGDAGGYAVSMRCTISSSGQLGTAYVRGDTGLFRSYTDTVYPPCISYIIT